MSKIHVLTASNRQYTAVLHTAVPAGNNTAGKAWKACLLASGEAGTTILTVGTDPSNITQSEADDITAGDVLEFTATFPAESGGATTASLNAMVDKLITDKKATLQSKYKYFGFAQ